MRIHGAAASLAALLGACDVAATATGSVSSDSMAGSTTGEDSDDASSGSTGQGPGSTEIAGEESSGAESTGASDDTGGDTTGPTLLPDGAPCSDPDACESAVCSPLGVCAPACPCALDAACVAAACIVVGEDAEGAEVAINDSPLGTITPGDVDVYAVTLPGPGIYSVNVHGIGVTAWIVDATGAVLADPTDAMTLDDEGAMTARDFEVADASEPVLVIIVGPDLDSPTDYYFWTQQL